MYRSKTFRKMLISISLICLCFYGIGIFSNHYSKQILSGQLQATLDSRVGFWSRQLEQEMSALLLAQSSLANDSEPLNLYVLWDSYSIYQRNITVKTLSGRLLNIKVLHDMAESIRLYCPRQKKVISADSPIYDVYEEHEEGVKEPICLEEDGTIRLTTAYPLNIRTRTENVPYFYIQSVITPGTLGDTLTRMLGDEEGGLFLLGVDGELIAGAVSSGKEGWDGHPAVEKAAEMIAEGGKEGWIHVSQDGFASGVCLESVEAWLVYCYPDRVVSEPLRFFRMFVGILTLLTALLLGVYAFYARKVFAKPINRILNAMEGIRDRDTFLIEEKGEDELTLIYHEYNGMVHRMEKLIRENLEAKYRVHMAEFKQLQYQIQPHFLYNSLFLIYRMAQMEENDTIAEYAEHLGKYYQYITRAGSRKVYVQQEIDHIRNYLAIQKTRFGSRITVQMDELPEGLEKIQIAPLILQPLVENAWEHGVKNLTKNGCVWIRMSYENGLFLFQVEDNGPGITEEELAEVRDRMKEGRISSEEIHAISNTDMRLKLHYGKESGLILENRKEGGFRITAKIHLKDEQECITY